ncbi:hypothetical protein F2Q68_00002372 [Brassica cretica]|uniref:FBD domain-containing protein n=2 Tax=Brassica cretica TaxID=69181 RepID=A0ABQ7C7Y0_BRACR|nr:hypothetical protein F2Q68_00002372 [Brassica cretica]KAF3547393.1 hypothetical protein DY000_02003173 [Brassica cretica]
MLWPQWFCLSGGSFYGWLVPRLLYDDRHQNIKKESFSRFVDRSLLLHEAPILDYLHFKLSQESSAVDIGVWARTVARRHVRELAFLSNCPILEDLFVNRCPDDNVTVFTGFCVVKNEMPNIVTADFDFYDSCSWKILSSITSVRDLCLCLSFSKNAYPSGYVFHRLVNFKLCRCKTQWLNLLMCMLRASPKSRSLQLYQKQGYQADQPNPIWSELSLVPECLLTSLETVEWTNYEGTKEEKEVVEFILRNGLSLTKVTISSKPRPRGET